MKILVADDDLLYRQLLDSTLTAWGYDVQCVSDGNAAMQILTAPDPPRLAVVDWMMPQNTQLEVVRTVRAAERPVPTYLILLTAKGEKSDVVAGLDSGADDYLVKPFHQDELRARLRVGQRFIDLQQRLADRVQELSAALANVKQLQGLLPICCYCKRVRDDQNYWQQVDSYISAHSEVQFSHSICPACFEKEVQPLLNRA